MKNSIYFLLLIFCSCSSAKYYSRYRVGGNSNDVKTEGNASPNEISEPTAISPIENPDGNVLKKREIELHQKSIDAPSFKQPQHVPVQHNEFSDTILTSETDSTFIMDEALSQAYASPAINFMTSVFGLLTTVNPNFIWLAAPFGFASMVCVLVGIICFFVALARYSSGKIDRRNKKWLWIWLLTFLLTSAMLGMVALMIL